MTHLFKRYDFNNCYESYSAYLEAQADYDKLREKLGDDYFNKWMKIKDKIGDKIRDPEWVRTSPDEPVKVIPNPDRKFKNIYDILKYNDEELEELEDFLDNFQSKAAKTKQDKEKGSTKVAENENYIVLRITTYKAAQKYGEKTTWCITGRYEGHEEKGEYYFDKYIRDEGLDGGYYFYLSKHFATEKYCLLVHRGHDSINSLWDSEDNKMRYIPDDILEVSEGLPFYDAMEEWKDDVWSAVERADTFDEFCSIVDYNYDYRETNNSGIPLGFKLLEYWESDALEDLDQLDKEYAKEYVKEFVNMKTGDGDNILDYVKPYNSKTVEFIFSNGFNGSVDNWLGSLRKGYVSDFADIIKEYVDFSKVNKDDLGHFLSLLDKEQALEYIDYMANKGIIQLAINTEEWDVLDHLHKPFTEDDAERILGTLSVVINRPELATSVIDSNIINIDDIRGHHYIFWLLQGTYDEDSNTKQIIAKLIKHIIQTKKVDTNAIIDDISNNMYSRDASKAVDLLRSILPKETDESRFYSSLDEAKQKDAGVIVKVGNYWRIKGNTVKYWPAKFKTRDDALDALRAYHAQRNG